MAGNRLDSEGSDLTFTEVKITRKLSRSLRYGVKKKYRKFFDDEESFSTITPPLSSLVTRKSSEPLSDELKETVMNFIVQFIACHGTVDENTGRPEVRVYQLKQLFHYDIVVQGLVLGKAQQVLTYPEIDLENAEYREINDLKVSFFTGYSPHIN